ncbi:aquaporin-5 [Protobothrops mucrosquamatus]|uniref:aquaporin-5 n=1 Tax=Protobothrops mucrosquamatus TaxID=103944 RepID=UPI000775E6D2|nr:aquaporin-5 [Protobothrops mucrosquamatus]
MATTTERRSEILSPKFAWAILCEFVGTAIFLCIAMGSSFKWPLEQPNVLQISLAFGLTIATMVQIFGPISGAHINPAVTLAYFVGNQISIVRFVFYMILQVMGALAGTGIIYSVTPGDIRSTLFANNVSKDTFASEAFVIEIILTFSVVMCIFSVNDKRRRDGNNAALSIGLAVSMAHLIGIYYTGCSINPARSFAPAVILGKFGPFHWVFWMGPFIGGILAAIIYNYVLCPQRLSREERLAIFKGFFPCEDELQQPPGNRSDSRWNNPSGQENHPMNYTSHM